jgi:hypothetical protein
MGEGNTGLKSQFGVGDPNSPTQNTPNDPNSKNTGSDKQARDFQAAFEKEQSSVNGHLQYTAVNAEAARHDPLAARRDTMFTAFQSALAKIDPKDPSKAKADIDKVLGDARKLNGEVTTFRQQAEKAKTDWDARQGRYDEAVAQTEELEAWGDAKAPALRGLVDGIRTQVNQRQYAQTNSTLDAMLPKLAPIYEAYLKQKEAKTKYDAELSAVQARLTTASASDHVKLAAQRDALGTAQTEMESSAQAKNYVAAVQQLGEMAAKLDAFEVALQELEQQKKAYEDAMAALQPQIDQTSQSSQHQTLAPMEEELLALKTKIDTAAQAEDFALALTQVNDLSTKADQYITLRDELDAKKTAYEQAYAALQPRLPSASEPGGERIVALQQAIATQQNEMISAAEADDYDTALQLVNELEPQVTELETALAARQLYDEQWAALQPKLPQASSGSPALAELEASVDSLRQQAETAAAADDYEQASTQLTTLESTLAELETATAELAEKRQAYEEARAALEQHLPTATEPGEGRLAEVQTEIQQSLADADAAAAVDDYGPALEHVQALETQLAELDTLLAARDEYQAKLAALQPRLPTSGGAAAGRLAEVQTEIETRRAEAEAAAQSSDFEAALQGLTELEDLLTEYEELARQRDQFEERWAELQPRLPEATEPDAAPEVIELNDTIVQTRSNLESKAAEGDYEGALLEVDEMVGLLSELEAAKEEAELKREEFELAYASTKEVVEQVLATPTDIPAVQEKLDGLKASKAEVDEAVAQNDYDTAQAALEDVDTALATYEEELRKQPRNCDWINATATALMAGIMRHYMQAQSKIDRAAQAYDEALAAHKAAVAARDAKKQLASDLLVGIFFAGLGGAVGGAVAGGMKSSVEAAFGKAAASGAILDATKDIAKFTTRSLQQLGGSPGDPTSVSGSFGGSGVELARNIGQAVNSQGEALLGEVEKLANMVRDNPEACDSKEGIRVEGDPAASMGSDPFLKVLASIASASKTSFAKLLWATWIDQHAYSIEERCDDLSCSEFVEDDVEDFYGWWSDLVKNIEAQAGADFGLRTRLDEARRKLREQIEAREQAEFSR